MAILDKLAPHNVWKHFEEICNIPHPSKHEEGIAKYIIAQANKLGLQAKRDDVGNVLVTKPGKQNSKFIALQGHMDMVPVARQGISHDFLQQPIQPKIEGDYVRANDTTLGADNGIGVAMMLAIMEEQQSWGNLEFLFTVNEEAGMEGARGLKADFLNSRFLINLDSEEWGEVYISCAGGGDSYIHLPVQHQQHENSCMEIKVTGLKGGHSGCDIHLGRGNGNKIMGRLLQAIFAKVPFCLRKIEGGNKRNSIADGAIVWLDANDHQLVKDTVNEISAEIAAELEKTDPDCKISCTQAPAEAKQQQPISIADSKKIVDLLVALPHGIQAMSPEVAGLVETSTNLGVVECKNNEVMITMLTRSAVDSSLKATKQQIKTISSFVGATVEEPEGYPGWKPNMDSPLLKAAQNVYRKIYNTEPNIKAIHAGLECGLFAAKLPGVDMISFGPDVNNPHTPDEEVYIPSVAKSYQLLKDILNEVSEF